MKTYKLSYTADKNQLLPAESIAAADKQADKQRLQLLERYAKFYESLPKSGLELKDFEALETGDVVAEVKTDDESHEVGLPEVGNELQTGKRAIAIGAFDALHLGHQELLNNMLYEARLNNLIPAVYTFEQLQKSPDGKSVMTVAQRQQFLGKMGVAEYYSQLFNAEFAALEPTYFVTEILCKQLNAAALFVGEDFRFGRQAGGDTTLLADLCKEHNIKLTVVPPVKFGDQVISTAFIRKLLLAGEVEFANKLMGHPFAVSGVVHAGKGLARSFRFPTANISWNDEQIRLPYGVYATRAKVENVRYSAITNFGVRPTVTREVTDPEVETSLLEVEIDLYQKEMTVEFLNFQRPEKKYPSFLILTTEIQKDVQVAREYLRRQENLYCYFDDPHTPIYHLPSERFSCNCLSLLLSLPLTKENATKMTLLGNILTACSAKYPSRQAFSRRLDALYGMHFNSSTCSLGDVEILQLDMACIKMAPDGTYNFREAFHFMFDSLTKPFLDADNIFNRQIFEQEKHNLILDLQTKIDDRETYALKQAIDVLFAGTNYVVDPGGELAVLENLTAEDITEFWQQLLEQAHIQTFVGGSMTSKSLVQLKELVQALPKYMRKFKLLRNVTPAPYRLQNQIAKQLKHNFLRSRYLLFFSNLPAYSSRKMLTLHLLLAILAGDSQSLLFKRIRENLGLVYGINYDLLTYMDCLVLVFAFQERNMSLLESDIRDLWQQITTEGIDDEVFNSAKLLLRNQLLNMGDALVEVLTYHINNVIAGLNLTLETSLDCLQNISKEEVETLVKSLTPRGFFHVVGEGQEDYVE